MRAKDGGVEMVGGDGSETGLVTKKKGKKSTTGMGASLTLDYRERRATTSMSPKSSVPSRMLVPAKTRH